MSEIMLTELTEKISVKKIKTKGWLEDRPYYIYRVKVKTKKKDTDQ